MKSNEELKSSLTVPICNWRNFLKFTGPEGSAPSKEEIDALDSYFQHFTEPGVCIKCGCRLGSDPKDAVSMILRPGTFRWGIIHGEGFCSTPDCGWPARAYHHDVGPIKSLALILQYHPRVVNFEEG